MKKNAIVSLADEKYFDLLLELIESIKRFPESENIAICVLDAGLNQNQISIIKNKVDEIKKAEDLAKAYVSLPVRRLIFIGASTPTVSSIFAKI